MKIAILTQPLHTNYGGVLQAYAMQTFLQKHGHDVVVINREHDFELSPKLFLLRIGSVLKTCIHLFVLRDRGYYVMNPFSPFYHTKWSGYDILPFVKQYINHSKEIRSSKELKKYFEKNKFDCYVVGSDQVWRPCYSPCITDFFLKEVPTNDNAIKVAYAASFGTENWEFSDDETNECSFWAKKFDAVSVRENSGIKLCKEYFRVEASHLLDPTMLLDISEYTKLFEKANVSKSVGNLFCYVLDKNDGINCIIQSLVNDGYTPNFASLSVEPTDNNTRPYQKSVEEWLRGFYDAELVITDSFHACVFSILFNKPFIVWNNVSRGNTRFDSLLSQFELQNRLIYSYGDFDARRRELLLPLNKEKISNLLELYRDKTYNFFNQIGVKILFATHN